MNENLKKAMSRIQQAYEIAELFDRHGIAKSRVSIYLLVRKDLQEADERVQTLHQMCKSFNLKAQAERNAAKGIEPNQAQLYFCGRYIYKGLYKKENWIGYCERHGMEVSK